MQKTYVVPVVSFFLLGCPEKAVPPQPAAAAAAAQAPAPPVDPPTAAVPLSSSTHAEDTKWTPVNPKQPEGPQMALIQGTLQEGPFTAVVKFPAGMEMPPHSHPADFTGVVLSGTIHNGRSADDNEKLVPGSAWTETANAVHYTGCAEGTDCIIGAHMDGAMGVTMAGAPAEGELGMVVTSADSVAWAPINPARADGPQMFVLSGEKDSGAFRALVKLPAGGVSPAHSHSATYSAVVLAGSMIHGEKDSAGFAPGSYWTEGGGQVHVTGCAADTDCVFFASMDGPFDMVPAKAPEMPPAE